MSEAITLDLLAIGERIRGLRKKRTQQEFADLLGASRMSVVRYEAGARTPDAEFLVNLHRVTGADVVWVLTGDGAAPPDAAPVLTAEEQLLLDYFRAAGPVIRRAALGALVGAAPGGGIQQSGPGIVGNISGGQQVVGNNNVTVGGRIKKR